MKTMQNLAIIFVLTFGFQMRAEYILYRVGAQDPSIKRAIDYDRLSPEEQLAISELYKKTIERYQWPTVIKYFSSFVPEERDRYLQALDRKNGLSDFIAHAVATQSQGMFGALWISATVFEMVAILHSLQLLDELLINELRWNNSRYLAGAQIIVFAESQLFKIFDFILGQYVNLNQTSLNFIQKIGEAINVYKNPNELLVDPRGANSSLYSYEYYPMYNQAWLPIIKNYLLQEQQAMERNCFPLSRGTNGFKSDRGLVVDYETGGAEGLSYGYSLLAGTFFERYYGDGPFRAMKGARSIDYIYKNKIGYVLLLSIKDALIGDEQKIFSFPALSTFMGLFGLGEAFHPRLRLDDLGFAAGGFGIKHVIDVGLYTEVVAALTIYLADAKLIKFTGTIAQSQQCLQEDIEMQKQELFQSEIQHFISIDRQEKVNFLHQIIMPWVQSGGSLKNISDDMFKMFSDNLINSLTDEQLASLPQKTLEQLKKDRLFSERLNPKKPLAPEPGRRLTKWF